MHEAARILLDGLLAAATVTLAGHGSFEAAGFGVLYVVIASLVVWVPVGAYLMLGRRADDAVARSRAWITANEQLLAFRSLLGLGVLLVGDGLVRILA